MVWYILREPRLWIWYTLEVISIKRVPNDFVTRGGRDCDVDRREKVGRPAEWSKCPIIERKSEIVCCFRPLR